LGTAQRALDRPVAEDGGAVHHATLRQVVERRVVSAEPVVPEGDVAELPTPTDRELGLGEMGEEEGEQRIALFLLQLKDTRRKPRVDEQPRRLPLIVRTAG
jgi:hypothetical protein